MSNIFASYSVFLTRLITLGILFSIAVNAAVVIKPEMLGILPFIPILLASKSVLLTSPLIFGIFLSERKSF